MQVDKKTLFQAFCLDRNVLSRQLNSPALRCPTTSARLPFLTLVMKAPNLPDSVILPPTTCSDRQSNLSNTGGRYTQDTSQAPPRWPLTPAWLRLPSAWRRSSCWAWSARSDGRPPWTVASLQDAETGWRHAVSLKKKNLTSGLRKWSQTFAKCKEIQPDLCSDNYGSFLNRRSLHKNYFPKLLISCVSVALRYRFDN